MTVFCTVYYVLLVCREDESAEPAGRGCAAQHWEGQPPSGMSYRAATAAPLQRRATGSKPHSPGKPLLCILYCTTSGGCQLSLLRV